MIQKLRNWVSYKLRERDIAKRLIICELLFQKRKSFFASNCDCDEKWIRYDNPKRKKSWMHPGESSTSTWKQNIHKKKIMLRIWWNQVGVMYYELLQLSQTINAECYRQHLLNLNRTLKEKRPQYAKRHDKIILLHNNARPPIAKPVKEIIVALGWNVLPYPLFSPHVAPSDYHLFRSMQHAAWLSEQHFSSFRRYQKMALWLDHLERT